jgi:superfamily II DNA or RNA helicase
MEKFLEWLKEEAAPSVWAKGVNLSRAPGSFEKLPGQAGSPELKFKVQTPERILAFQVTLWTVEQDAHCDCGSKFEPCHHIIGAAMALSAGRIPEGAAPPKADGVRITYHWEYRSGEGGAPGKIRFLRSLETGGKKEQLRDSLVALIGGIRSGRIRMPLPSTTQNDLAIDSLYSSGTPTWRELLQRVSELPPLPILGHPGLETLSVDARVRRPRLLIRDSGAEDLVLLPEGDSDPFEELLEGNLRIRNGVLSLGSPGIQLREQRISGSLIRQWTLGELPDLRERFEIRLETSRIPEVRDGEPVLRLIYEPWNENEASVTARIEYPDPEKGVILKPDPSKELELSRRIRRDMNLVAGEPKRVGMEELLRIRDHLPPEQLSDWDRKLGVMLERITGAGVESTLEHRDLLIRLLDKRKSERTPKGMIDHLLRSLPEAAPLPLLRPGAVPEMLFPVLRPYQKSGVAWLKDRAGTLGCALLADDMGLGKTLQTLASLEGRTLVVLPRSLLGNWKQEAARFRPDLLLRVYHGPGRKLDPESRLILTTYSILKLDAEILCREEWDQVVLDEAHLIRNPETRAAIAASRLQARFRIALTGTPIQNRLRDLHSLMNFLAPGVFDSEEELTPRAIAPFLLRRTKDEVLTELPPKTLIDHSVPLDAGEKGLHDALLNTARQELLDRLGAGETLSPLGFFESLLRARQACCHPGLVDSSKKTASSSKVGAILDLTRELLSEGHSVLLYSQWTSFLDLIEKPLRNEAPCFRLDGSTRDREGEVERFQTGGKPAVFLLSLQAGGVGLNLTRASHVVFCDPWWNPFVEVQAEDRAYRMGQEKPVTIHRLIAENTIEERIRALQLEKLRLGSTLVLPSELKAILQDFQPLQGDPDAL